MPLLGLVCGLAAVAALGGPPHGGNPPIGHHRQMLPLNLRGYDADGDGFLSHAEVGRWARRVIEMRHGDMDKLRERAQHLHEKVREELLNLDPFIEVSVTEIFHQLDRNYDQLLDDQELQDSEAATAFFLDFGLPLL